MAKVEKGVNLGHQPTGIGQVVGELEPSHRGSRIGQIQRWVICYLYTAAVSAKL